MRERNGRTRLVGWLVGWVVGWVVGWLLACLVGWLVACLLACLLACLVGWLVGWLVGGLVACLVARSKPENVCSPPCFLRESRADNARPGAHAHTRKRLFLLLALFFSCVCGRSLCMGGTVLQRKRAWPASFHRRQPQPCLWCHCACTTSVITDMFCQVQFFQGLRFGFGLWCT